jgi:hypothetical protein
MSYTSLPLIGLFFFIGLFLVVVVSVIFHRKSDYVEIASLPLQDNGEVQQ